MLLDWMEQNRNHAEIALQNVLSTLIFYATGNFLEAVDEFCIIHNTECDKSHYQTLKQVCKNAKD